jgi:hypothetical protein
MSEEGDRWFFIEQDRKREQAARDRRLKTRLRNRDYARESRHRSAVPVKMKVSKRHTDEHGNRCRTISGE